jgi:DNA polymerase III gamma/tau subunit
METKSNLMQLPSDQTVTRTAAHVAADINKIKMKTAVVLALSAVEMGRLLCEAKSLVPHGEWGAWLEANVDFSESKAQTLMRCYKEYGDGQIDMITGTSDLDFFSMLTVSQMDALLALPKPERRDFVEDHREELESGDMSVRDMKVEIAKLKMENKAKTEALEKATGNIERLEKDCNDMNALLEEERRKPTPEPMVQEVIVHRPSEEDIEKIRAAEEQRLRDEFEAKQAETVKDYERKLTAAEKAKKEAEQKAEEEAEDAGELHDKLKKIETDHKAAMDKLKAEYEKKLAEAEANFKKQAKASAAGADGNVVRIQIALESFKRELSAVSAVLVKMRAEGGETAQKADKLQANVEKILGALIAEAGWKV